ADELRHAVGTSPDGKARLGVQIAGYVPSNGQWLPTFYHVHDGPSDFFGNIDPNVVNANHDRPPLDLQDDFRNGKLWTMRNGAIGPYAAIWDRVQTALEALRIQQGIEIPHKADIHSICEFAVLQIRFVASLFSVSNLVPGIGGGIDFVGINEAGIQVS